MFSPGFETPPSPSPDGSQTFLRPRAQHGVADVVLEANPTSKPVTGRKAKRALARALRRDRAGCGFCAAAGPRKAIDGKAEAWFLRRQTAKNGVLVGFVAIGSKMRPLEGRRTRFLERRG